jgi:DNA polymerase-4
VSTSKLVSQTAIRADRRFLKDFLAAGRSTWSSLIEVNAGGEASFLAPHVVDILPDLSPPIRERLDDYQLDLIGEVAVLTEQQACSVFGRAGSELVRHARGIDPRPVLSPAVRAEFRLSHTLGSDSNDLGVLHALLRRMTERLGRRLRARHLAARRIVVELGYTDYKRARRGLGLPPALLDVELWDAARRAFTLANARPVAIRTVTVTADRIVEEEGQLDLFWSDSLAKAKVPIRQTGQGGLQAAIDRITTRWGAKGLARGLKLQNA